MEDLRLIKKYYGEKMSHLCRELFPTILEKEGKLFKILSNHFAYSKYLYDDIIKNDLKYDFKNYIYSINDSDIVLQDVKKTPQELMDEAGYILYKCTNYDQVEYFKKYFTKEESLCTFNHIDERLENNYVFFAVKKDVDNIKREQFKNPERQDLYGTSVISLQFTKGDVNTLSIKNRYNHSVPNPDATFSNNLDNIIDGLTASFSKEYDLNISSDITSFEIPGYVKANDKKYYKYNYEINNIYYCPDNIIIDNFEVKQYDKERYIILDYFMLDMKEKTIKEYDKKIYDSFVKDFKNIDKIEIKKDNSEKNIIINDNIIITLNKCNNIIKYSNEMINYIGSEYLYYNNTLTEINTPNVTEIDDNFLFSNNTLVEFNFPNVIDIGFYCLGSNNSVEEIYAPKVETIGDLFFNSNNKVRKINLPNCKKTGKRFFNNNHVIYQVIMPNVEELQDWFLKSNEFLLTLELPKVKEIGNYFLEHNEILVNLELPNVKKMGHTCLENNNSLLRFIVPKIESINTFCFDKINSLEEIVISESIVKSDSNIRRFLENAYNVIICTKDNQMYKYDYSKPKQLAMHM